MWNDRGARPEAQVRELPENLIYGRNPVLEALKAGRDIEKILIARGEVSGSLKQIVAMAGNARVVVQYIDRVQLDKLAEANQGVAAYLSAATYSTVEDIFSLAAERGEPPFIIILDGVTDPQNVGAIARSAECAGAHGIIVPQRRAAGLTPVAVKTSAGAFEHIRTAKVVNIARTVEELKARGVWVFGADADGEDYTRVDYTGPLALVIGSEGEGISRLVLEKCDRRVSIPMYGKISSLNASCAAAVLMFQAVRGRKSGS